MAERIEEERKGLADSVGGFLTRYRVLFIGGIVALIVVAVAWGILSSVSTASHRKGLNQLESIVYTLSKAEEDSIEAARETALSQILDLAAGNKGNIVGLRANMAAAEIYFSQKQWAEAKDCWLAAATVETDAYTAPLCYYNAAVCAEELADVEGAIACYESALASDSCDFKTHVLFSLGRLHEEGGDFAAASESYMELQNSYPSDSWTNLAESRLIALRAEGRIQ